MFKKINDIYYNLDFVFKIKFDKKANTIKLYFNNWNEKIAWLWAIDFDLFVKYITDET